jgi:hypothetical protein
MANFPMVVTASPGPGLRPPDCTVTARRGPGRLSSALRQWTDTVGSSQVSSTGPSRRRRRGRIWNPDTSDKLVYNSISCVAKLIYHAICYHDLTWDILRQVNDLFDNTLVVYTSIQYS